MPLTRRNPGPQDPNPKPMNPTTIEALITQHVTDAIANLETDRNTISGIDEGEYSNGNNLGPPCHVHIRIL